MILPWAFICAKEGATEQEFRQQCLQNFTKHKALDFIFDSVKQLSEEHAVSNKLPQHQEQGEGNNND